MSRCHDLVPARVPLPEHPCRDDRELMRAVLERLPGPHRTCVDAVLVNETVHEGNLRQRRVKQRDKKNRHGRNYSIRNGNTKPPVEFRGLDSFRPHFQVILFQDIQVVQMGLARKALLEDSLQPVDNR